MVLIVQKLDTRLIFWLLCWNQSVGTPAHNVQCNVTLYLSWCDESSAARYGLLSALTTVCRLFVDKKPVVYGNQPAPTAVPRPLLGHVPYNYARNALRLHSHLTDSSIASRLVGGTQLCTLLILFYYKFPLSYIFENLCINLIFVVNNKLRLSRILSVTVQPLHFMLQCELSTKSMQYYLCRTSQTCNCMTFSYLPVNAW